MRGSTKQYGSKLTQRHTVTQLTKIVWVCVLSVVFLNGHIFCYNWSKNFCCRLLYYKFFNFLQNQCKAFYVNVFVKKILRRAALFTKAVFYWIEFSFQWKDEWIIITKSNPDFLNYLKVQSCNLNNKNMWSRQHK